MRQKVFPLPTVGAPYANADTAGIVNNLSPEPPVNHLRHMGAITWTKLILIKSAQRLNHLIL